MRNPYRYIGVPLGIHAAIPGCEKGPEAIYNKLKYLQRDWIHIKGGVTCKKDLGILAAYLYRVSVSVQSTLRANDKFINFVGDHSCALGTWDGVNEHYQSNDEDYGIIWVDARMDAHTADTSPTGDVNGMSVAALLGHGNVNLTKDRQRVKPQNLTLIGTRAYEPEERALLEELGVMVYYMDTVRQKGFAKCLREIVSDYDRRGIRYGMSLDLCGLDPFDVNALGTLEDRGIQLDQFLDGLHEIDYSKFIGLEIAEYNPTLDTWDHLDIDTISEIVLRISALSIKEFLQ